MLFDHNLAWKNKEIYDEIYKNSIEYPDEFWRYHESVLFPEHINNACYNCLDRHLLHNSEKTAIIWYGDEIGCKRTLSYSSLFRIVQNISHVLLQNGVKSGDIVTIYANVSPESVAAMLACARIGAVHNVIFAGFSHAVLEERVVSSNSKVVLTVKHARRGGKSIKIAENAEKVAEKLKDIKLIFLEDITTGGSVSYVNVEKDHDLFRLYTSGSTGKPKSITHKTFEYLLYTSLTFKYIFDIRQDDVYFCTSDIGWITGHSYMVYAPLFHGSTIVLFEGNPTYPTASRYWEIIEEDRVSLFYTAPTAIRSLSMFDKSFVNSHDISSLRILGSVGEPINIDAWQWYFDIVGQKRCPIIDTWWQTETGGIVIAPLLDISHQKPGYASKPFFGVRTIINEEKSLILDGSCCFRHVISGDRAEADQDGDIKIIGRIDDVMNVSGHRLGATEIENVINSVDGVCESAVVSIPHEIKGESIFVFVIIESNLNKLTLVNTIIQMVKNKISSIAKPNDIAFVNELPKTRSGKIKRDLLKKVASNEKITEKDLESLTNKDIIQGIEISVMNKIHCPDFCSIKV